MQWTSPQYTTDQIDAAGQALVDRKTGSLLAIGNALTIINNWRSSHAFPLNTMQMNLRGKTKQVHAKSMVAQRIKRQSSIESKLVRFDWLSLSKMQDLGGCRAVVKSVDNAERLIDAYRYSRIKHRLIRSDDYIGNPKKSGYRGYHLIYAYHSDRTDTYNGLKIELQVRSNLQHIWATAVETVGTFTEQELKSSEGEEDWLTFFALMSSVFAHKENRPLVPNTPDRYPDLLTELTYYATKLDVVERLNAYGAATRILSVESGLRNVRYFLLQLDFVNRQIRVRRFGRSDFHIASQAYLDAEQEAVAGDAVLVSVESLDSLRRAYPNYFLDIRRFLQEVKAALS